MTIFYTIVWVYREELQYAMAHVSAKLWKQDRFQARLLDLNE